MFSHLVNNECKPHENRLQYIVQIQTIFEALDNVTLKRNALQWANISTYSMLLYLVRCMPKRARDATNIPWNMRNILNTPNVTYWLVCIHSFGFVVLNSPQIFRIFKTFLVHFECNFLNESEPMPNTHCNLVHSNVLRRKLLSCWNVWIWCVANPLV